MKFRYEYGEVGCGPVNKGWDWYSSESECCRWLEATIEGIRKTGENINLWWKIYDQDGKVVQEGDLIT